MPHESRAAVRRLPEGLLGRAACERPDHGALRGEPDEIAHQREPEVAELRRAARVEPDVRGPHVPVDLAEPMRVIEAAAHALGDLRRARPGRTLIGQHLEHHREIAAQHVLRHDAGLVALVSDVVDRDDALVVPEPARRPRLAAHARELGRALAARLDDGDGDVAVERSIMGPADTILCAAPSPQKLDHLVAPAPERAGQRGRRGAHSLGVSPRVTRAQAFREASRERHELPTAIRVGVGWGARGRSARTRHPSGTRRRRPAWASHSDGWWDTPRTRRHCGWTDHPSTADGRAAGQASGGCATTLPPLAPVRPRRRRRRSRAGRCDRRRPSALPPTAPPYSGGPASGSLARSGGSRPGPPPEVSRALGPHRAPRARR